MSRFWEVAKVISSMMNVARLMIPPVYGVLQRFGIVLHRKQHEQITATISTDRYRIGREANPVISRGSSFAIYAAACALNSFPIRFVEERKSVKESIDMRTEPPFASAIAVANAGGNRTPSLASVSAIHFASTGNGIAIQT